MRSKTYLDGDRANELGAVLSDTDRGYWWIPRAALEASEDVVLEGSEYDPEYCKESKYRSWIDTVDEDGGRYFREEDRAELWARVQEELGHYPALDGEPEPVAYDEDLEDTLDAIGVDEWDISVPLPVAREGKAWIAAFLRAHGARKTSIAGYLDVGEQTVSQYLSDVKAGRR